MADTTLLTTALKKLPLEINEALAGEYVKLSEHLLLGEWDDLQVDAGRFIEAALRVLEWYVHGSFTPIDGKSKPVRSRVLSDARTDKKLPPTLRQQIPMTCELVLDFRNNRNSAHLGNIDPAKLDAVTVAQLCSWLLGELIRIEAGISDTEIQQMLNDLAERPASLVYEVEGWPVILSDTLKYPETALVLLYAKNGAVNSRELFSWSGHSNITAWRKTVLNPMAKQKDIFVRGDTVHLLPPGIKKAETIISIYQTR